MNHPSINRFILPSPVSTLFFFLYVPLRSSLPLLSIPLRTLDISRFPCRHVPRRGQAMSLSHVSFTHRSHTPSSGAVVNVTFPAFSPVLMFMLSKMSPFFFSSNESGMYFFFILDIGNQLEKNVHIKILVVFHHQLKFTSSRYNFNLSLYKS